MHPKLLEGDTTDTKTQKFFKEFMSDDSIAIKEMLNTKEGHLGMAWKICKNDGKILTKTE